MRELQPCCTDSSIAHPKKSGCIKSAQLHANPEFDTDVKNVLQILKNLGKLKRSEEDTSQCFDYSLIYCICITSYVVMCGVLSLPGLSQASLSLIFAVFVTVSKRSYILYKGTDFQCRNTTTHISQSNKIPAVIYI
jgi:hypothetical protein